ncbi:hypothetical protein H0H92_010446 [Tricholoma furcatifolium]|nr:hypothetical protein H0H92_010446 [Tricholoma furcatifolium]
MASAISRRCWGTLGLQQIPTFALAGPSRHGLAVRGYAAAAAKQKKAPSAKKSASAPSTSTKTAASSTGSSNTAKSVTSLRRLGGGGVSYKMPEKKENTEPLTEEEQMAQLEQVMNMAKYYPTADPWGMSVETLDYPSWGAMFDQFKENRVNSAKNYSSLLMLAQENGIPGIDLSGHKWWHKFFAVWPWRLATTTSVKKGSWLEPLRASALSTYQQLNTALARGDDKTLKSLATDTYQDEVIRLRKKQNSSWKYIWNFHKEVTPARVVSIRASQGYLATEDPKFGNRMMVHALVRLDTEQSLEIYNNHGLPMHTPAEDAGVPAQRARVPAKPVRVTEYFVFEKRMWYDGPWLIREQLWEAPGKKPAV